MLGFLVRGIWDWLAWAYREAFRWIIAAAQTIWGKWLIILGWAYSVWQYGLDLLYKLSDIIGSYLFSAFDLTMSTTIKNGLKTLNYILPVQELIIMTIVYAGIALIMMLYRHIKSLVPGPVSGGT